MLQLEDQECTHSATLDKLRLDHKKEINELQEQMKQLKKELKGSDDVYYIVTMGIRSTNFIL